MRRPGTLALVAVVLTLGGLLAFSEVRHQRRATETQLLVREINSLRADLGQREAVVEHGQAAATAAAGAYGTVDSTSVEAIASLVAAKLAAADHPRAPSGATTQTSPEPAPAVRSVEAEMAIAHAGEVVQGAIQRGRLAREDVLAMRSELRETHATPSDLDAVRSQIAVAINAGKLVPEDRRWVYP